MNWTFATFLIIVIALVTSVLFEGKSPTDAHAVNTPLGQATLANASESTCTTDAECVPKTCCHPSACVPRAQQPDCTDIYCTGDCKENTLDCNQGQCACINQSCKVLLN